MSKPLKIIAVIATVVAVVATAGAALGVVAIAGVSLATVGAVASAVAGVASLGAAALQKKPGLRGSISGVLIGATMPIPYAMGLTMTGGMQVYDNSGDTKNIKRYQVMALSAAGPIEGFETFLADYSPVGLGGTLGDFATGWYASYLYMQKRLGARPETAHFDTAGMPNWTAAHKMSGYASYRVTMKFDKDGKRFASGVPQFGVVFKGVKVYDPRLDTTYPGGAGTQRYNDEATWAWSENPGLHALAYARGRYIEKTAAGAALVPPVKIVGAGLPKDAIDIASFVEFANLCDANAWKIGGLIYEGPDLSKWDNLKRICQAGAAKPMWSSGMLRVKLSAPRPSLFRIEANDIAEGSIDVQAMKGFRERRNSIIPKYRSPDAKWEYVQSAAVTASTYVTEDGEVKTEEVQFDLVQGQNQAAQLAAYELVNGREFGPVTITVKPKFLSYRLGEAGTLHIPEAGLTEQLAIIVGRSVNPATGAVTLTFESETNAKHAYALGLTGTAPPTPVIRSSQELDEGVAEVGVAETTRLISDSAPRLLTLSISTTGVMTVSNHERVYADKFVAVTGATVTPSPAAVSGDKVGVFYDDELRAGGAVVYQYSVLAGGAGEIDHMYPSPTNPYRHFVALLTVPASGTSSGGSGTGPGTGGTGGGTGGGFYSDTALV